MDDENGVEMVDQGQRERVLEAERLMLPPQERSAVPPQDHYDATDNYLNLVLWYHRKSNGFHIGALVVVGLLNLGLLLWVLQHPKGPGEPLKPPAACASPISGYEHYTPVYWVVALAAGLISLFILRYSHPSDTEGKSERMGNQIREADRKSVV